MKDSYQDFLNYFNITKHDLYDWGIASTIFVPFEAAEKEWNSLKDRVLNNGVVYIRRYGQDGHGTNLYTDFYKDWLGNNQVQKDPSNNTAPHRLIQKMTGLKLKSDISNFQISHIWGHTKNVFMFEAPWNICYTPKLIDPFTGHEASGVWPNEYQAVFLAEAMKRFKPLIDDYNQLLKSLNVDMHIQKYIDSLKGTLTEKILTQFSKDILSELTSIT